MGETNLGNPHSAWDQNHADGTHCAFQKAPEGWRTPGRLREARSVKRSARFWSAAALRRFGTYSGDIFPRLHPLLRFGTIGHDRGCNSTTYDCTIDGCGAVDGNEQARYTRPHGVE